MTTMETVENKMAGVEKTANNLSLDITAIEKSIEWMQSNNKSEQTKVGNSESKIVQAMRDIVDNKEAHSGKLEVLHNEVAELTRDMVGLRDFVHNDACPCNECAYRAYDEYCEANDC